MRNYDRTLPLIVIHVPKAAGTSVKAIFKKWYGDALFEHYFNEYTGEMPPKRELFSLHTVDQPVAVYGHFNRLRGFGVEDYYPGVGQFITILRDPFETAISRYFFLRKNGTSWQDQSRIPKTDLRQFLIDTPPNMLNQFPRKVTKENYRDLIETFFIQIGVMEHLSESVQRIADSLGMPFKQEWLPHENATARDQDYPSDLREEYAERHTLEFDVYNYVVAKYMHEDGSRVAQQCAHPEDCSGSAPITVF